MRKAAATISKSLLGVCQGLRWLAVVGMQWSSEDDHPDRVVNVPRVDRRLGVEEFEGCVAKPVRKDVSCPLSLNRTDWLCGNRSPPLHLGFSVGLVWKPSLLVDGMLNQTCLYQMNILHFRQIARRPDIFASSPVGFDSCFFGLSPHCLNEHQIWPSFDEVQRKCVSASCGC